jgi:hypothetical protein
LLVELFPNRNNVVKTLRRETLEAEAVGGASTVKLDRRHEEELNGAQRAVQSKADSRKLAITQREWAT